MPRILRHFAPAMAMLVATLGSWTSTRADLIIDQQNTVNQSFVVTTLPSSLGQSFTPTLNSIDFATLLISNTNASTYKLQLFSGDGFGGTLLGTSNTQAVALAPLPANNQPFTTSNAVPVEFDFTTPIALTPGSIYTLLAIQVTGNGGYAFSQLALSNTYSGGVAYFSTAQPTYDLVFNEGIHTSAVPEPSSLALCWVAGLGGLGYFRARRKRTA